LFALYQCTPMRSMPVSIFKWTCAVRPSADAQVSMALSLSTDDAVKVRSFSTNNGDLLAHDAAHDEDGDAHTSLTKPQPSSRYATPRYGAPQKIEVAADLDQPVAVGIGLENHQHRHPSVAPQQLVVGGQTGKVDVQHGRAQHISEGDGRFVDLRHLSSCVPLPVALRGARCRAAGAARR
jgi:hypothetical protein